MSMQAFELELALATEISTHYPGSTPDDSFSPQQKLDGKRKLLRLASLLDTVSYYDQSKYTRDDNDSGECGSPACALGHWAANNRHSWSFQQSLKTNVPVYLGDARYPLGVTGAMGAMVEFSLSLAESVELFGTCGCGHAEGSATRAANYIRRFVKLRGGVGEAPEMAKVRESLVAPVAELAL